MYRLERGSIALYSSDCLMKNQAHNTGFSNPPVTVVLRTYHFKNVLHLRGSTLVNEGTQQPNKGVDIARPLPQDRCQQAGVERQVRLWDMAGTVQLQQQGQQLKYVRYKLYVKTPTCQLYQIQSIIGEIARTCKLLVVLFINSKWFVSQKLILHLGPTNSRVSSVCIS